jgi:hypothetical protein
MSLPSIVPAVPVGRVSNGSKVYSLALASASACAKGLLRQQPSGPLAVLQLAGLVIYVITCNAAISACERGLH